MQLTTLKDLESFNRNSLEALTQRLNLHDRYDNFLKSMHDDGPPRQPGVHASEVAGCLRQTVYTLYAAEKRPQTTAVMQKRFETGKALHNMLQTHFETMAAESGGVFTFQREVGVEDTPLAREYFIESHCDGIFTFYDFGKPVIRLLLEIKTSSPDEFAKLNKPQDKHVRQAHVYMACLDIPLVWYLYWNKGNQNITHAAGSFLGVYDAHVWGEMLGRIKQALQHADEQKLPDREEGFHCSWCPYAWTCEPSSSARLSRQRPPTTHRAISK